MREIHFTIVTATLAAALLQWLTQAPQPQSKAKLACSCAPRAIPS